MERKQSETSGRPEGTETGRTQAGGGQRHGSGEGAASAWALLKRLERDRADTRPADDSPGG